MKNTLGKVNRRSRGLNQQFRRQGSRKRQSEKQKEKRILKSEDGLRDTWDSKHDNICLLGALEGEEKEQEIVNLLEEIVTENFPHLVQVKDPQVWKHREFRTR